MLEKNRVLQIIRKYMFSKTLKLQKIHKFQNEKYNIVSVFSKIECQELILNTDVFVSGSDQIWNAWHSFNPFFFLSFVGDCKRVAYASSMGSNNIPSKYKQEIKTYLSKFSHIGLREQSAVPILQDLLERNDIVQVLDPTFLLSANDWNALASEANIEFVLPDKYILCYFIGNNDFYIQQLLDVNPHCSPS